MVEFTMENKGLNVTRPSFFKGEAHGTANSFAMCGGTGRAVIRRENAVARWGMPSHVRYQREK